MAILETDDFIAPDMCEILYLAAVKHHADYAKADYKKFFSLENGGNLYSIIRQFEDENTCFYGKILNPHTFDYLYKTDFNIWRGIYRRDFLIRNNIYLNESAGASYQDIGFMEKVMAAARRAVYLDRPFYYYRVDRDEASSCSVHSLENTQYEFQKLIEYFRGSEKAYWRGICLHMMTAFLNEYEKTLKKADFQYESPECSNYYVWFADNISQAIKEHIVSFEDMEEEYADKLKLLLNSPRAFAEFSGSEKNRFREYVENLCFERPVQIIIFGAGHWGYEALKLLREKDNCQIQAFADNDEEKQGIFVENVRVCSLGEAVCKYPTAVIFIANEKYYSQIRAQIEQESKGHMILCPFD